MEKALTNSIINFLTNSIVAMEKLMVELIRIQKEEQSKAALLKGQENVYYAQLKVLQEEDERLRKALADAQDKNRADNNHVFDVPREQLANFKEFLNDHDIKTFTADLPNGIDSYHVIVNIKPEQTKALNEVVKEYNEKLKQPNRVKESLLDKGEREYHKIDKEMLGEVIHRLNKTNIKYDIQQYVSPGQDEKKEKSMDCYIVIADKDHEVFEKIYLAADMTMRNETLRQNELKKVGEIEKIDKLLEKKAEFFVYDAENPNLYLRVNRTGITLHDGNEEKTYPFNPDKEADIGKLKAKLAIIENPVVLTKELQTEKDFAKFLSAHKNDYNPIYKDENQKVINNEKGILDKIEIHDDIETKEAYIVGLDRKQEAYFVNELYKNDIHFEKVYNKETKNNEIIIPIEKYDFAKSLAYMTALRDTTLNAQQSKEFYKNEIAFYRTISMAEAELQKGNSLHIVDKEDREHVIQKNSDGFYVLDFKDYLTKEELDDKLKTFSKEAKELSVLNKGQEDLYEMAAEKGYEKFDMQSVVIERDGHQEKENVFSQEQYERMYEKITEEKCSILLINDKHAKEPMDYRVDISADGEYLNLCLNGNIVDTKACTPGTIAELVSNAASAASINSAAACNTKAAVHYHNLQDTSPTLYQPEIESVKEALAKSEDYKYIEEYKDKTAKEITNVDEIVGKSHTEMKRKVIENHAKENPSHGLTKSELRAKDYVGSIIKEARTEVIERASKEKVEIHTKKTEVTHER